MPAPAPLHSTSLRVRGKRGGAARALVWLLPPAAAYGAVLLLQAAHGRPVAEMMAGLRAALGLAAMLGLTAIVPLAALALPPVRRAGMAGPALAWTAAIAVLGGLLALHAQPTL